MMDNTVDDRLGAQEEGRAGTMHLPTVLQYAVDKMPNSNPPTTTSPGTQRRQAVKHQFLVLYSIAQLASIFLFAAFVEYKDTASDAILADQNVRTYYQFYTDVAYMIWFGFGFLMCFLRKYMYSAIGYTFLLSSLAMQYVVIWEGLLHHGNSWTIDLDLTNIIGGLFGAGAMMISFGAVLGKASPTQLFVMTMFGAFFFALEGYICFSKLGMSDTGGSLAVHAFGAYFGLACSFVMGKNEGHKTDDDHPENGGSYISDMFAMVGTLFLWILWPSFNGALVGPDAQLRVLLNTLLALNASSVGGFVWSRLLTARSGHRADRFSMLHVQNATLAGGVMLGSSCDLIGSPAAALAVGAAAALVCTLGYECATPWLNRTLGLNDTMGVHNLHGMPGLLAAATSACVLLALPEEGPVCGGDCAAAFGRPKSAQAGYQVLALLATLGLALGGGALTGAAIKGSTALGLLEDHGPKGSHFTDDRFWVVPSSEDERAAAAAAAAAMRTAVAACGCPSPAPGAGIAAAGKPHRHPCCYCPHGAAPAAPDEGGIILPGFRANASSLF
mmetsp:Transcript_20981/g.33672  ORF Transcript_20981/g.33672 Transcript_20981/m.33672 type:complete len:557 (-) Transcript_20981:122-1792(-)